MPFDIGSLRDRARSLLGGFTTGQKTMLALAAVALVVGGVVFMRWAATPAYAPLFTNLEPADAAAVTEELAGRDVPYQLKDGGRSVFVPRPDLYDLRIALSAEGLPAGGTTGYAILDDQGITTSEFRQRVDYQRALEGELTKTITAIDGVDAANVHLVIPKETLFADDSRQASASVLLRTSPGRNLSSAHVRSVVHLVSSSVEGLESDQVTVADTRGAVLSAPGDDATALGSDARSEETRAFENAVARSVENMLVPVVGVGGAVVQVAADLDFDKRSTTTERYENSDAPPALSEATSRETFTGAGAMVGGVLGPEPLPADGAATNNYEKEDAQRTYALDRVVESVEAAPGQVRRLSVAVLLDGNVNAVDDAEIADLVSAATGLDPERGDNIEVRSLAFDETAAQEASEALDEAEAARRRAQMLELLRDVAVALIVAVGLLFAWRSSRRTRREPLDVFAAARPLAPGQDEDVTETDQHGELELVAGDTKVDADVSRLSGPAEPMALEAADAEGLGVQSEIAALVERQPEEVAQLLRGWLADRRA